MKTESVAVQLDAVWRQYRGGSLAYTYAVQGIRRLVNVTVVGARDLLDSEIPPSVRYVAAASGWPS